MLAAISLAIHAIQVWFFTPEVKYSAGMLVLAVGFPLLLLIQVIEKKSETEDNGSPD